MAIFSPLAFVSEWAKRPRRIGYKGGVAERGTLGGGLDGHKSPFNLARDNWVFGAIPSDGYDTRQDDEQPKGSTHVRNIALLPCLLFGTACTTHDSTEVLCSHRKPWVSPRVRSVRYGSVVGVEKAMPSCCAAMVSLLFWVLGNLMALVYDGEPMWNRGWLCANCACVLDFGYRYHTCIIAYACIRRQP